MITKSKKMKKKVSEDEIDDIVVKQANDDSAWEEPIHVCRTEPTSFSLPPDLVARVAFLARLHRETDVEEWLIHIIRERIELEEVAFVETKREMAAKASA